MSNNLKPEKVQEVLQQIDNIKKQKPPEPTVAETHDEWNRLAQFMRGKA